MFIKLITLFLFTICFTNRAQSQSEQSIKKIDLSSIETSKIDSLNRNLYIERLSRNINNAILKMPNFLENGKNGMPSYVPDCFGNILIAKNPEDFNSNMPIKKLENKE